MLDDAVGHLPGGRPFDKDALSKIPRNRTYLGEAVRKGKSCQGEHELIVTDETHTMNATTACQAKRPDCGGRGLSRIWPRRRMPGATGDGQCGE